jgi:hypothetical protein
MGSTTKNAKDTKETLFLAEKNSRRVLTERSEEQNSAIRTEKRSGSNPVNFRVVFP